MSFPNKTINFNLFRQNAYTLCIFVFFLIISNKTKNKYVVYKIQVDSKLVIADGTPWKLGTFMTIYVYIYDYKTDCRIINLLNWLAVAINIPY